MPCRPRGTACASTTSKRSCCTNSAATAAQSVAYNSIVAAGPNACVLHYRAGPAELRDGDLCLIDAGCEFDGYASDITRTFPCPAASSPAQRELYDLVLAAQDAAIAETRVGVPYNVPHDAAVRVPRRACSTPACSTATGKARSTTCLPAGSYRRFYAHRTGHWLGMDVHDVGEYRSAAPAADGGTPVAAAGAGHGRDGRAGHLRAPG
ncbi:M24 family metallopeptidase [Cupriavidus basilensis]